MRDQPKHSEGGHYIKLKEQAMLSSLRARGHCGESRYAESRYRLVRNRTGRFHVAMSQHPFQIPHRSSSVYNELVAFEYVGGEIWSPFTPTTPSPCEHVVDAAASTPWSTHCRSARIVQRPMATIRTQFRRAHKGSIIPVSKRTPTTALGFCPAFRAPISLDLCKMFP